MYKPSKKRFHEYTDKDLEQYEKWLNEKLELESNICPKCQESLPYLQENESNQNNATEETYE